MHILQQTIVDLQVWLAQRGLPGYRAAQVWKWLFEKRAGGFDVMSDLPVALRRELGAAFEIWTTRTAVHRTADDGTEKLVLELHDRQQVECVLLRDDRDHHAICISTQVGCGMGCVFCASGLGGVVRNLTRGEIIEEMLRLQQLLPSDKRLSHIVVMGMGEPLANLDALLPALELASGPQGLGISARRITVSTVGLPAAIRRLARAGVHYHLALSLHAPNDELRNELVPTNRKIGIGSILEATDDYFEITGRRITYEYILLGGLNDQSEHARQLVELLAGRPALVNLIPYNPVEGLPYRTPASHTTARFVEILSQGGLNVKIRYRKGARIDAACGQLRRSLQAVPPSPAASAGEPAAP